MGRAKGMNAAVAGGFTGTRNGGRGDDDDRRITPYSGPVKFDSALAFFQSRRSVDMRFAASSGGDKLVTFDLNWRDSDQDAAAHVYWLASGELVAVHDDAAASHEVLGFVGTLDKARAAVADHEQSEQPTLNQLRASIAATTTPGRRAAPEQPEPASSAQAPPDDTDAGSGEQTETPLPFTAQDVAPVASLQDLDIDGLADEVERTLEALLPSDASPDLLARARVLAADRLTRTTLATVQDENFGPTPEARAKDIAEFFAEPLEMTEDDLVRALTADDAYVQVLPAMNGYLARRRAQPPLSDADYDLDGDSEDAVEPAPLPGERHEPRPMSLPRGGGDVGGGKRRKKRPRRKKRKPEHVPDWIKNFGKSFEKDILDLLKW